ERKKQPACSFCQTKYSLTNSEHLCKRCKRSVCEKCAVYKDIVQRQDSQSKSAHRQCNFCRDEKLQIQKTTEQFGIAFNKDTISITWLQSYGTDVEKAKKDYEQARYEAQQSTNQDEYLIFKTQLGVILTDIDTLQNYSLKDFSLLVTKNVDSNKIKDAIEQVTGTFLLLHPAVGFSPELVLIVYFLLCFASEASAYLLLNILFSNIFPPYLYYKAVKDDKYDFKSETQQIIGILKEGMKLSQNDQSNMELFVGNRIQRYILQLSLNMFLFETSFFIINQVFTQGEDAYAMYLKLLAIACNQQNGEIQRLKQFYEGCELAILRNVRQQQLSIGLTQLVLINIDNYRSQTPSNRESINTANLSLSRSKIQFASVQAEQRSELEEENAKLKQKIKEQKEDEKNLKIENYQLNDRIQKLQMAVDSLQAQVMTSKGNSNDLSQNEQDVRVEMLIKQNKQLHERLEAKEAEIIILQNDDSNLKIEQLKQTNQKELEIIQSLVKEKENRIEDLLATQEQMKIASLIQLKEIAELKDKVQKGQDEVLQLNQQIDQQQKQIENLQFKLKLKDSQQDQEQVDSLYTQQIEQLNTQLEEKAIIIREKDTKIQKLKQDKEDLYAENETEINRELEIQKTLKLEIEGLNKKLNQQELQQIALLENEKNKIHQLKEEIAILSLQNEQLQKKLEGNSDQEKIYEYLQTIKFLEGEVSKFKYEIEFSGKSSDTGSMVDNQKSTANYYDELQMQGELINELNNMLQKSDDRCKELERRLNNNEDVMRLKAQNEIQKLELNELIETIQELKEQIDTLPTQKKDAYQINVQLRTKDGGDDQKNQIEVKNFQNVVLKGLLKENQQQIEQLNVTLQKFKVILNRPRQSSKY
ncbi:hypothetical protein pb186bvf_014627, partial [Paramecium bursaria]